MAKLTRAESRYRRHQRVRKQIEGTPARPRLNVYRSLAEIYAQVIDDLDGRTLVSASTIDHEIRTKVEGLTKSEQAKLVKPWQSGLPARVSPRLFLTGVVSATWAVSRLWQKAPVRAAWFSNS